METAEQNFPSIDTSTAVSNEEKAFLLNGKRKIPILARCASQYSLAFRYLGNQHLTDTAEPVNLLIHSNGQQIELGPCRILPEPDGNGYGGRLVFTRDIYDVYSLFANKKIVRLQSAFGDLPRLLERKHAIRPAFRDYTTNLAYDMGVYKKLFDDLDAKYRNEPEDVRNTVQKAIIATQGPHYYRFFDDKLDELKYLVEDFSREEHQLHGFYFRKQLWDFILCCPFAARSTLKPRGYAGDSEQMRMMYLNDYQGETTFSKLMHKHAVGHAAAQSVRNRTTLIAQMLSNFQQSQRSASQNKLKVLSIGCGPAFELLHILQSPEDCDQYRFALFDQDSAALSEASELIDRIEQKLSAKPDVGYVRGSVRTVLFSRRFKQNWGQFHFIYSMGLFDYLSFRVAKAILDRLYRLLKPGGELAVGNFHVSNLSRYYMEYWGDWVLRHRTEQEFREMVPDGCPADFSLFFDNTGSQMFLHLKKPSD